MGSFVEAGKSSNFKDGTRKRVVVQGHEILLARVGDKYYATDNRCTHLGGKLSQGKLEGTVVTCPRHGSKFDVKDGSIVRWLKGSGLTSTLGKTLKPPLPLATYNMQVDDNKILVEI